MSSPTSLVEVEGVEARIEALESRLAGLVAEIDAGRRLLRERRPTSPGRLDGSEEGEAGDGR